MSPAHYVKAIVGALIAALSVLVTTADAPLWLEAVLAGLVGFAAVYGVKNRPRADTV